MTNKTLKIAVLVTLLAFLSAFALFLTNQNQTRLIRVACVGDSLTQSSRYPYELWLKLGKENYALSNFGAGGTMISLNTETPYMNTTAYQDALNFQPNIVIIMLGTNDAQPNLKENNATLTQDYVKLINSFKELPSNPQIWITLPPPIYSNQSGAMDSEYFVQTVIPCIKQAANQTGLPTIDVYSALLGHPEYFKDGIHVNDAGAEIIANEVYKVIRG
ncbi:MAG: GDSL-type esterase/lipase family protein [Candidatus Bathyarchaeia archaeon]|jgi:lysophospholipase L1-like esterase